MRRKLGEILVEAGVIDDFQLQASLGHQRQWGGRVGEIIVSKGFATAEAVADALAKQLDLQRFVIGPDAVDPRAAKLISTDLAQKQGLVPYKVEGDRGEILWIAMKDPTDLATLDEIQFQTGKRIMVAVASEREVEAVLAHITDGTPLVAATPVPREVEIEELSEVEVLTEVVPMEEVEASPVNPAAFVSTPAAGFSAPPVVASPVEAEPAAMTPAAFGAASAPQIKDAAGAPGDVDADLAALGLGEEQPLPAPRPAPAAPEAAEAGAPEPAVAFDADSAVALIGEALDRMAEGEALPLAAERFVNPTQMAAALTRLLIRKGVIDEIELIDELQKK